jgi:2,4-dienoyl-CoA reductase-like NADH-dependent reductase (Old Yellow Enzyme family)
MLFQTLKIANGKISLKHRVVLASLTRNPQGTAENPNRIWYPDDLMAEHYRQRAMDGGLLITEGIPPSLEVPIYPFLVDMRFVQPSCLPI